MRVIPVSCLQDNYAYLVGADGSAALGGPHTPAVVVDPSEAGPVVAALEQHGLTLAAILCTHHHWDHVGGNEELAGRFGVPVYAHVSDRGRVPGQTEDVEEGRPFEVAGLRVEALHVPGHTTGAVAYCIGDAVFTGDTLFLAGCGRLFEGTPAMMATSLDKLARLPATTRVFCGHEYTTSNLRFAAAVEPDNAAVAARARAAEAARSRAEPTVPGTIADELATNPFLRTAEPAVAGYAKAAPGAPRADVFAAVRAAKDGFR